MISSTQLEAFYERYQREGVPNDLSMQAFCSLHNVPYNCFERYVRQRTKFKNIHPVRITDIPEAEEPNFDKMAEAAHPENNATLSLDEGSLRGDMTSEEYIIRLLQTIESLDSMVRSLRDETSFLRDELALLREKDAERKCLMALIEAKNQDNHRLSEHMARLLGKVDSLTKALEDKSSSPIVTVISSAQRPTALSRGSHALTQVKNK